MQSYGINQSLSVFYKEEAGGSLAGWALIEVSVKHNNNNNNNNDNNLYNAIQQLFHSALQ